MLRGIDAAFDRYEQRPSKTHEKINSILLFAGSAGGSGRDERSGSGRSCRSTVSGKSRAGQGFEPEVIVAFLRRNADLLEAAKLPQSAGISVHAVAEDSAATLRKLAQETENRERQPRLEDLERHLTVLEEKLFAALLAATPDEEIVTVRAQADRELAPYRRKMAAAQIEQLQKQYVHKRLLEKYGLPRLSLFYM